MPLRTGHHADFPSSQLNLQMIAGLAFPFYSEARINFLPTYKFDLGTDEYDTSYVERTDITPNPDAEADFEQ